MMPTTNINLNMSAGGVSISGVKNRTADSAIGYDLAVPAAKAGALTTRDNNTSGEITLEVDHGIETAEEVDLYWDGGYRLGVTVGTVDNTAVPVSDGSGDNLPAENTAIRVAPILEANVEIDGDNVIALGMQAVNPVALTNERCHVDFLDGSNSAVKVLMVTNEPRVIDVEGGDDNPFDSEIITNAKLSTSHTGGVQFRLGGLIDSTP